MSPNQLSIRDVVAQLAPLVAGQRVKIVVALAPDLEKRAIATEFGEAVREASEWVVPKALARALLAPEAYGDEVILTIWGDASPNQKADQIDLPSAKSQLDECGGSFSVSRDDATIQVTSLLLGPTGV